MKRAWLFVVLAFGLSVLVTSIGCATFPPRNPDGSLNITELINDAAYGIEADCALGFNVNICTFGRDTIDGARAAQAKDLPGTYRAVRQSLIDSEKKWPVIVPYVQWFIDLLNQYAPPLGN